jgi:hypothetical protein
VGDVFERANGNSFNNWNRRIGFLYLKQFAVAVKLCKIKRAEIAVEGFISQYLILVTEVRLDIPKRACEIKEVLTVLKKWIESVSGGVLDRDAQYSRSGMISANKPVAASTARSIYCRGGMIVAIFQGSCKTTFTSPKPRLTIVREVVSPKITDYSMQISSEKKKAMAAERLGPGRSLSRVTQATGDLAWVKLLERLKLDTFFLAY